MFSFLRISERFTGTWYGFYKYDMPAEHFNLERVPFEIVLKGELFYGISGTVQDDASQGGMVEQGIINGRIIGDSISFKKKMPKMSLDTKSGRIVVEGERHDTIYYKGEFDNDLSSFSGTWVIRGGRTVRSDNKLITTARTTGTWEMSKNK